MAGLTYYTLAYVGIRDNSLRVAWTAGLICVVGWMFAGLFYGQDYLEHYTIRTGVARLKVLENDSVAPEPYTRSSHYGQWFSEDLIHQKGGAEVFIATRVKEETIHHTGASRDRGGGVSLVEGGAGRRMLANLLVAAHDHPKFDVHEGRGTVLDGQYHSTKDLHGVLRRVVRAGGKARRCGTIWGEGATEITHSVGSRDEVLLADLVCAAGIDAGNETRVNELLYKGITLSLTYTYTQSAAHGMMSHLRGEVPITYELAVAALPAQAKTRSVERLGDSRLRTSLVGITIQVQRGGWIGVWHWNNLLQGLVMKTGVLGLLTHALDFYWQFVLPLTKGVNYNKLVYKEVGLKKD